MSIVASPTGSSSPATLLSTLPDPTNWRAAVTSLVAWLVANDRCFSSGEVTAYLRAMGPASLRFSATGVGEFLRGEYDNGLFPSYTDTNTGTTLYPTQVPRTTNGTSRTLDGRTVASKTAPGQPVFVYAKDGNDGFAHDFEVYIPDFDDPTSQRALPVNVASGIMHLSNTPMPAAPAPRTMATPASPAQAILITGSLKRDDVIAYVRPDGRLCIPRAAFEAYVALDGSPLRGGPNGDSVWVTFDTAASGDTVSISRTGQSPPSVEYHLWATRGRIAIQAGVGMAAFVPGEKFKITVSTTGLVVDLSVKV